MVRHASDPTPLSGTTPVNLWEVTVGRKAKLTKIMIFNADSVNHTVELGSYDGATFTQLLPKIPVATGQMIILNEDDIPGVTVATPDTSTIMAWAARIDAAVTANDVEIQVEVDEA